jgi:hypothetical protein
MRASSALIPTSPQRGEVKRRGLDGPARLFPGLSRRGFLSNASAAVGGIALAQGRAPPSCAPMLRI